MRRLVVEGKLDEHASMSQSSIRKVR